MTETISTRRGDSRIECIVNGLSGTKRDADLSDILHRSAQAAPLCNHHRPTMKTNRSEFTQHINHRNRAIPFRLTALLLAALCAVSNAPAGDGADGEGKCPPCKTTARLVRLSALNELQSDYWLE